MISVEPESGSKRPQALTTTTDGVIVMAEAKPTIERREDRASRPKGQTVWWLIAVWVAFNAGFVAGLFFAAASWR
jgi:hypothetical protein